MYYIKPIGSVCYNKEYVLYGAEDRPFDMENLLITHGVETGLWSRHFGLDNLPLVLVFFTDNETAKQIERDLDKAFPHGFIVREVNW